ncbi:hypothetical protein GGR55DRAFT_571217 [Xylaria sp. FL0064]|nr:hypothetical protein GGR55DRAFT_571217 [Xylaria sp. FL0064]
MSENTPLFARTSLSEHDESSDYITTDTGGARRSRSSPTTFTSSSSTITHYAHRARTQTRRFFASRAKHWLVLTLILLDVAGILAEIFIALITCELHRRDEAWVAPTMRELTVFALAMSCVFMVELAGEVFSDGLRFFTNWFHCLDAFVIVVSFAVDLLEHGIAEEIASLVIVLRLWRFVKIVQEFSVEQEELMEGLRKRIEELEGQVGDLEAQLSRPRVER